MPTRRPIRDAADEEPDHRPGDLVPEHSRRATARRRERDDAERQDGEETGDRPPTASTRVDDEATKGRYRSRIGAVPGLCANFLDSTFADRASGSGSRRDRA